MNVIPTWVVGIAGFLVLSGTLYYVTFITGNRLDLSEQEIEDLKEGIRRKGLRHYFIDGVSITLLFIFAKILAHSLAGSINLNIFYLAMGIVLGITNLYIGFNKMDILALDTEASLIPRYKAAFILLGFGTVIVAAIGYFW